MSTILGPFPPLRRPGAQKLERTIFRGSVESAYGKRLRWKAEKELAPRLAKQFYSRNELLNEGVEMLNALADTPGVMFSLHMRKYNAGHWMNKGGCAAILRGVFGELPNNASFDNGLAVSQTFHSR